MLLVPLGDDFRYDRAEEWDNQYDNYQQLFSYMNSHTELNVQVREANYRPICKYVNQLAPNVQVGEVNYH